MSEHQFCDEFKLSADLLAKQLDKSNETIGRLLAELAEMRRTHVKVKEKCGTCGGNGFDLEPTFDTESGLPDYDPCPDCIDGLVLADGVLQFSGATGRFMVFTDEPTYVIPARLIEGEA